MAKKEIILFSYPESVFGRRVQWYLALRGISYSYCRTRERLPREELKLLGVNYRRIPILTIGRNVYCDSRLIIQKLEELYPDGALGSKNGAQKGLEQVIEAWVIDGGIFRRSASLLTQDCHLFRDRKFLEDRAEMTGMTWTERSMVENRAEGLAHIRLAFQTMENFMSDGREWILNTSNPTLADIHGIWPFDWCAMDEETKIKDSLPENIISETHFPRTFIWLRRFRDHIKSVEATHPALTRLSKTEAVQHILAADYAETEGHVDENDPLGLVKGQEVEVWPIDTGFNHHDRGALSSLSLNEVVITVQSNDGDQEIRIAYPRTNIRIRPVKREDVELGNRLTKI